MRVFEEILDPGSLFGVADVGVFDAHGVAVGISQQFEDVSQGDELVLQTREITAGEFAIQIPQS